MNDIASYELYGLQVRSEIPLHSQLSTRAPGLEGILPDVDIVWGADQERSDGFPDGDPIAHFQHPGSHYTFVQTADGGYLLRFYGVCDFVITADLGRVIVHMVRDTDAGLPGVLAAGSLLSFILLMRGHLVLHASAVQIGASSLAFVGYSGMGKSTMAAVMCADPSSQQVAYGGTGRLITDDVLRIDFDGVDRRPVCRLGATELRLRRSSAALSHRFPAGASVRITADARHALAPGRSHEDRLPLGAVVIPRPRRDQDCLQLTRLGGPQALIALASYPRVLGWQDRDTQRQQFERLATLSSMVPVYLADIPWGPPFPGSLAQALQDQLAMNLITR